MDKNDVIANAEDDEEEDKDKYTKRINLVNNILMGVLFTIIAVTAIILLYNTK